MKNLVAAFLLLAVAVASPSPAGARTFALVVGIDRYAHYDDLEGAAADARDIAASLRRFGAASVRMLLDGEASYRAIRSAWRQMVAQARRGDVLIFSYAGHGGQEPEAVPGSEADGKDETFLLGGFSPDSPKGRRERIVDNEINSWFRLAGDRGLKVIFIADSCHSGTMTRAVDERAQLRTRATPPYGFPDDDEPSDDSRAGAMLGEDDLPFVTFFAATQEGSKVPELTIEGHRRGALSWAFSRALEKGADRNHDGVLTRFELESYMIPMVRQLSDARQTPDIRPRSVAHDQPLLALAKAPASGPSSSARRLRMKLLHVKEAQKLLAALDGVAPAGPGEAADLIYDGRDRAVINGAGDMVAANIDPPFLQGVIDKWRTLPLLREMVAAHPLPISLSPDDGRHPAGEVIAFATGPVRHPHLAVIDLAPDGQMKYLYPLRGDPPAWPGGKAWRLDLRAMAPFGADHLLIVASSRPLGALQERLRSAGIAGLPKILQQMLAGEDYQIGLKGLYTFKGKGGK